jgi:hypothetical protein
MTETVVRTYSVRIDLGSDAIAAIVARFRGNALLYPVSSERTFT